MSGMHLTSGLTLRHPMQFTAMLAGASIAVSAVGISAYPSIADAAPATSSTSISRDVPDRNDVERGLALINSIPDPVLEAGDAATAQWFRAHHYGDQSDPLLESKANFWGCAGAIATIVASTAFPAAKILKIKRLIKALGGVSEAVRIMWGASFSYEKLQALGGAAAALAGEFLGIAALKNNCLS